MAEQQEETRWKRAERLATQTILELGQALRAIDAGLSDEQILWVARIASHGYEVDRAISAVIRMSKES